MRRPAHAPPASGMKNVGIVKAAADQRRDRRPAVGRRRRERRRGRRPDADADGRGPACDRGRRLLCGWPARHRRQWVPPAVVVEKGLSRDHSDVIPPFSVPQAPCRAGPLDSAGDTHPQAMCAASGARPGPAVPVHAAEKLRRRGGRRGPRTRRGVADKEGSAPNPQGPTRGVAPGHELAPVRLGQRGGGGAGNGGCGGCNTGVNRGPQTGGRTCFCEC